MNESQGVNREMKSLAAKLEQCPNVVRLNEGDRLEAWELVHMLTDIEESATRFAKLMQQLREEANVEVIGNLLLDIGEEFRHISYHISDSRFYSYVVVPPSP